MLQVVTVIASTKSIPMLIQATLKGGNQRPSLQANQPSGFEFTQVWFPKLSSVWGCHLPEQIIHSQPGKGLESDQVGSLLPR